MILYLSFCLSRPTVVSMGNRRRYLANNSNNSSQQPTSQPSSIFKAPSQDIITEGPTSQPSSIFKAPSQDIITEGPTTPDTHEDTHENQNNDKNIGGSQNINKEIVEEDAYALNTAKYSFYAILSFLLIYGFIQIIKRRSSSSVGQSNSAPQYAPVATVERTSKLDDDDLEDDESYFSNQNIELARRSPTASPTV
eukprot:CAMPEP_0119052234 /NCGR_PEP_ID=MMETSP1177-20130426/73604_1 /TAXON_ID=2985 /ORGANISM="Ochromonas sp, Strain CCMP1899" /LENGTH=194 /DNA_ID=CAMNT_0007031739 /DNA_START=48 /DNA_END=632 /DNA_ORIENTATION=+